MTNAVSYFVTAAGLYCLAVAALIRTSYLARQTRDRWNDADQAIGALWKAVFSINSSPAPGIETINTIHFASGPETPRPLTDEEVLELNTIVVTDRATARRYGELHERLLLWGKVNPWPGDFDGLIPRKLKH